MKLQIANITLLVKDYDEALDFYLNKLNFSLREDSNLGNKKRRILVSPPNADSPCLLLAKATKQEQIKAIGNQTGGKVSFYLHVDNFDEYYNLLLKNGVEFIENPRIEVYGKVVVFKDLYGNKFDLIEPPKK